LILEHPVRAGWKLADDLKPEEQSATAYRFRVEVPAKGTKKFVVDETSPTTSQVQLNNFNENMLEMYVNQKELTPEMEQALRQILAQKDAIAKMDADIKQRQADVQQTFQDQERLRENMKALKGTPEEKALLQRYTGELNDEENQLAATRKEMSELEAKRKQAQADLDASIEKMAFDVKM
jgi:septal ring factor EnvC (AmiA/AmiB activator)